MQKTPIEWCDFSSNPLYVVRKSDGKRGWACTHASPGCLHCYAETINQRLGTGFPFAKKYEDEVEWRLNVKELAAWFRHKAPGKCFVADMTDLFHPAIPDAFKLAIVGTAALTPWKIYQFLTKRAIEMRAFVETYTLSDCLAAVYSATDDSPMLGESFPLNEERADLAIEQGWLPKNTWWGVSVEDQQRANERIPLLLQVPAVTRFLSCEPLIRPIDLGRATGNMAFDGGSDMRDPPEVIGIHWSIIGGESGPWARPVHPAWVRSLRGQCQAAGIAFFWKQWGEWIHESQICTPEQKNAVQAIVKAGRWKSGVHYWHEGESSRSFRIGKKAAGRLIDGQEWSEFPT